MAQKIDTEFLKKLRGEKSQEEVAKAIGVTRQYYNYIESGERTPSVEVLTKLSEYYKRPIGKFFLTKNATKCCNI